jgi:gliding motility-associated lipoprotein GldD
MKKYLVFFFLIIVFVSCGSDTLPKPKPFLKLAYKTPTYFQFNSTCSYQFEISNQAKIEVKENCWASIKYPNLKATIHLTYREVDENLNEVLKEVEKLTFEHTIKADAINPIDYENIEKKVFGTIFNVEGNVATNIQFRVTDSTKHVLAGSLYFYTKPNYDSILPAVKYIEKDIIHLIETVAWKQ